MIDWLGCGTESGIASPLHNGQRDFGGAVGSFNQSPCDLIANQDDQLSEFARKHIATNFSTLQGQADNGSTHLSWAKMRGNRPLISQALLA
jgi:hypothetical protein